MADEKGKMRLERISRHYSAKGSYAVDFVVRMGGGEQQGELMILGNNAYMKLADTEIFVADTLCYEVRGASKEIVVDRVDARENELLNPLNGFLGISANYDAEECDIEGRLALRLTPKHASDTIYFIIGPDGESIAKVQYGVGESRVEIVVGQSKKQAPTLPTFSKERYNGYELIDFR